MWFFKKRKETKNWEQLHLSLKNSFTNIKKDMADINMFYNSKHKDYDKKHSEHEKNIQELKEKLLFLERNLIETIPKKRTSLFDSDISFEKDSTEDLTEVQMELLYRLAIISHLSEKEGVTLKALSKEMYPEKSYSATRSLLSDYTALLSDLGLVEKKIKGRKAVITITEKGKEMLPENFYNQIKVKIKKQKEE